MSLIDTLKKFELFGNLEDEHLEKVAVMCQSLSYPQGTTIFHEGDEAKDLSLIVSGKVALEMELRPVSDRPAIPTAVEVVSDYEIVGWSALVKPFIYTLTGRCMTFCSVLSINGALLRKAMTDDPVLGFEIMSHLAQVISLRLTNTRLRLVSGMGIALLSHELEAVK